MAHSKTKFKSNEEKAPPFFQYILNRNSVRKIFAYLEYNLGLIQTHFN